MKSLIIASLLLFAAVSSATDNKNITLEDILGAQEVILDPVTRDGAPLIGFEGVTDLAAEKVCEIAGKVLAS